MKYHNIISQYQINRSRWRGNINRLLGEVIFPFGPVAIRTEAAGDGKYHALE